MRMEVFILQYEIQGAPFSVLVCKLNAGEAMKCQKGGMAWMSSNMKMQTSGGGLGKMLGKLVTGESMFYNTYSAEGGNGEIAFGMSFPGNIIAVDVSLRSVVAQKRAFMACEPGVGNVVFGGEGLFNTVVNGPGKVWLQTMPVPALANSLIPYLPTNGK